MMKRPIYHYWNCVTVLVCADSSYFSVLAGNRMEPYHFAGRDKFSMVPAAFWRQQIYTFVIPFPSDIPGNCGNRCCYHRPDCMCRNIICTQT